MNTAQRKFCKVVIFIYFLSIGIAQAAEPIAMVTDVIGNAWLQWQGKEQQLNVLSYLEQDGSVRLDSKATITITTFNPAAEYVASGPARLELTGGGVRFIGDGRFEKHTLDERKAKAASQFSTMQRERLIIAAFEMKGLTIGLKLLVPINTELLNVRPLFRWSAPQEAKSFILTLFDESNGSQVEEVSVGEPIWQLPDNLTLHRQHHYSWRVRSALISGDEIASVGKFSIVDEARSNRILQQKPSRDATFSERVLYAVLLETEGLRQDAAVEWKSLAAERQNEPLLRVYLEKY